MKKIIFLFIICIPFYLVAQQNLPTTGFYRESSKYKSLKKLEKEITATFKKANLSDAEKENYKKEIIANWRIRDSIEKLDTTHFRVLGIGNISDETLKSLNAGGKLAIGFCSNPFNDTWQGNYFASFNKNSSNTDSAISTTLVFPEAGSHSFLFTSFWKSFKNPQNGLYNYNGLFLEFVSKKITNKKDTTDPKSQVVSINSLHYTAGYKWGFSKMGTVKGELYETACDLSIFASFVNIPDEDHDRFQTIANLQARNNSFFMIGAKVSFELNGFQIFADLRHVFGNKNKLPLTDLHGFSSNIGVAFTADILRF
jgi:hypothetical protein